jgi:RNA methyltransferase, TrmH family
MITSNSNVQIKNIVQLNTSSKARREQGVFVAEGIKMFLEATPNSISKIYVAKSFYDTKQHMEKVEQYPYEIVEDAVFKKASDTVMPQGIICIVKQKKYEFEKILESPAPHLILLEGLQDPGNLGTIIRTGEGAGVDGVIMSENTVDIYNPKVIRATMGSIYRMPFFYTKDLEIIVALLHQKGISTYAAHLEGEHNYDEEDYQKGCAFLIGNEGNGLTASLSEKAERKIKIPMHGKVESLNAAISATILMYEVNRQRREKK